MAVEFGNLNLITQAGEVSTSFVIETNMPTSNQAIIWSVTTTTGIYHSLDWRVDT
jgi:hypothetical protein